MRKWIRERVKRRKKADDSSAKEQASAPAPLQPKYFESDVSQSEPEIPVVESQPALVSETEEPSESAASVPQGSPATAPSRRRRRGRRGRSGATRRSPV